MSTPDFEDNVELSEVRGNRLHVLWQKALGWRFMRGMVVRDLIYLISRILFLATLSVANVVDGSPRSITN
jgi:hypothetical protein